MNRMFFICFAIFCTSLMGCIEKDFDTPPVSTGGVVLDANATIADLKEYFVPGAITEITDDILVDAIVVADDKGGNFYKKLILQDETGGIELLLNRTDLYTNYENGRTVYIRAKGLYISDYNGVVQVGGAPVPSTGGGDRLGQLDNILIDSVLLRGNFAGLPVPKEKRIIDLGPADISTLVKICDVQFTSADTAGTLANVTTQETLNKNLEDCAFNTLIVRTSGFADVGRVPVPNGKGCITGVYGVFRQDKQFFVRESFDLKLDGPRCGGGGGGGGGSKTLTLAEVRGLYNGSPVNLPANQGVQGVVISDRVSGTTTSRNLILQDAGYGIIVRFAAAHTFNLGDEIFIDVSGIELSEFNGGLQLNNVGLSNARLISTNVVVEPLVLTVAEIKANFERYEGTLVKIKNATLTADENNWAFNTVLKDATGTLDIFTYAQATFANEVPSKDTVTVTGYLNEFNNPQLVIRTLADVVKSGGPGGGGNSGTNEPVSMLSQDFQSQTDRADVTIPGWLNFTSVPQGRKWQARLFEGNFYAQATAFNDTAPKVDAWLITPPLDLSKNLVLNFQSATSFNVHQGLSVLISTNYSGSGDPASATWTPLPATLANGQSPENTFIPSGAVDLSAYNGKGYIAFRYEGAGGGQTSTFRVDNVVINPQ